MPKFGVPVWIRPLPGFVVVDAESATEAAQVVRNGAGDLVAECINSVTGSDISGLRKAPIRQLPCIVGNVTYYYEDKPDELATGYSYDLNEWDNDRGVPW